jgi:hypothetical protein
MIMKAGIRTAGAVVVLMLAVMPVVTAVIMLVPALVIMLVAVGAGAVLVPHRPRMARKSSCSTSTSATLARLQTPCASDRIGEVPGHDPESVADRWRGRRHHRRCP